MPAVNEPTVAPAEPRRKPRSWKRSLLRLTIISLSTYVAVVGGVAVFQEKLIYFPARDYAFTPRDIGLAYDDVTLRTDDGVSLASWFVPHDQPRAYAIFFHGNAGNIGDRMTTVATLHRLGYALLMPDYRGYGLSEGKPSEKGLYRDAQAAWRYVTGELGVPPGDVVIIGRSLGGAVAIDLASRHEPGALVVECTFTRLADVGALHFPFLPVRWILTHRFESIDKVGGIKCPKLFLHGSDDELIPIDLGRRLYEAAAEPKQFIETPGGHNEAGFTYSDEYAGELARFVEQAIAGSL